MCGEQIHIRHKPTQLTGSPPRVRGTVDQLHRSAVRPGITPACAGNSSLRFHSSFLIWDHPRVCGEQQPPKDCLLYGRGSPPRVRGTAAAHQPEGVPAGITPACAGNRWLHATYEPKRKDHPRVCGEQLPGTALSASRCGSPPRVRGTAYAGAVMATTLRITPACAGNSYSSHQRTPQAQDHPRVCGEQQTSHPLLSRNQGSPPRVRGTAYPHDFGRRA